MLLTPYQDGVFAGNGVAHVFTSEVAQFCVCKNSDNPSMFYGLHVHNILEKI